MVSRAAQVLCSLRMVWCGRSNVNVKMQQTSHAPSLAPLLLCCCCPDGVVLFTREPRPVATLVVEKDGYAY